eukprot:scaffold22757_cov75-Phaeocystis_antarctica.AAC.3
MPCVCLLVRGLVERAVSLTKGRSCGREGEVRDERDESGGWRTTFTLICIVCNAKKYVLDDPALEHPRAGYVLGGDLLEYLLEEGRVGAVGLEVRHQLLRAASAGARLQEGAQARGQLRGSPLGSARLLLTLARAHLLEQRGRARHVARVRRARAEVGATAPRHRPTAAAAATGGGAASGAEARHASKACRPTRRARAPRPRGNVDAHRLLRPPLVRLAQRGRGALGDAARLDERHVVLCGAALARIARDDRLARGEEWRVRGEG